MDDYVVIGKLPDADVGTVVKWNQAGKYFWYNRNNYPTAHDVTYLNQDQVENNKKIFCKANQYPEYYAYHNPVYSRKDILELIGVFSFKNSTEAHTFNEELRELGKENAEKLIEYE